MLFVFVSVVTEWLRLKVRKKKVDFVTIFSLDQHI